MDTVPTSTSTVLVLCRRDITKIIDQWRSPSYTEGWVHGTMKAHNGGMN